MRNLMKQTLPSITNLQVSDLVIDPYFYREALSVAVRHERLPHAALDHLGVLLPLAVAQLDAVGDLYGALSLAGLLNQLTNPLAAA
jgi:hypothetical protein